MALADCGVGAVAADVARVSLVQEPGAEAAQGGHDAAAEHGAEDEAALEWTLMGVSTLVFIGLSTRKPRTHRVFHYITAAICLTAFIAYFSLAANLGFTPIAVQYLRGNRRVRGVWRQVFYARYIDWSASSNLRTCVMC